MNTRLARHLLPCLLLLLAAPWRSIAGEPLHYLATGVAGDGKMERDEFAEFQESTTDDDGYVYAAGSHGGPVRFQGWQTPGITNFPATGAPVSKDLRGIFLTRQAPSGAWEYLRQLYAPIPATLNSADNLTTATSELHVTDIKAAGDFIYIAARLGRVSEDLFKPDSNHKGVVIKARKSDGGVLWRRFFLGSDLTTDAIAVDSAGRVYVGGGFRYGTGISNRILNPQATTPGAMLLGELTPQVGAIAGGYDAYVVQFSADGAVNWIQRSGGLTNQRFENVAAIEIDALDAAHVVLGVETTPGGFVRLNQSSRVANALHAEFSIGCVPNTPSCRGWATAVAGKMNADGRWLAFLTLDPDTHFRAEFIPYQLIATEFVVRPTDLRLFDGKVFVCGAYFTGLPAGAGGSRTGGFIVRLADDYVADSQVAYLRPGGAERSTYPFRMRVGDGQLLVAGRSTSSVTLHSTTASAIVLPDPQMEFNGITASDFVAAFSSRLNPQWIIGTAEPGSRPTPDFFTGGALAYNRETRQILWGGGFRTTANRKLAIGSGEDIRVLETHTDPDRPWGWGWMVGLAPNGAYLTQQRLVVNSAFGPIQVNNAAFGGEGSFLRGTRVTVALPTSLSANNGATRHLNRGYNVNEEINAGTASIYSFDLNEDTTLTFNWLTQHLLTIGNNLGTSGIAAGSSPGNPEPAIGSHWIDAGSRVNPAVQGIVADPSDLEVRYYVSRYTVAGASTQDVSFVTPVESPTPAQFIMSAPSTVTYFWRRQYSVNVSDTATQGLSLERTRLLNQAGTQIISTYEGPGRYWFDAGARVEIGTLSPDTSANKSLVGWQAAFPVDPSYFPVSAFRASSVPGGSPITTHLTSRTEGASTLYFRTISPLNQPVSILWDYDSTLYTLRAAVGTALVFPSGMPALLPKPPSEVRELIGTPGVGSSDAVVWDARQNLAFAIRPGVFELTWEPAVTGASKVKSLLYAGFDGDPFQDNPNLRYTNPTRYRHIAQTPGVDLDPSPTDTRYFDSVLFHLGGARIEGRSFLADRATRSVLLFKRNVVGPRVIRDPTEEILEVRVVDSRAWNSTNPWSGTGGILSTSTTAAVIGTPLTHSSHTSTNRSGYVFHENANYNPDIYSRPTATGPIIPVNNRVSTPNPASDRELVVVWYETVDGIDWPWQPVFFPTFAWPPVPTGPTLVPGQLRRIVIASRLGSEGLSISNHIQPSFDPELFSDVRIYNQPDASKAGFNPNEEHARIYPSLLASLDGKSVPAAFALRNDLNISAAMIAQSGGLLVNANYTSDPFVLVQFFDRTANAHRMAVYSVQRTDPLANDARLDRLPGSTSRAYTFTYLVTAGERIQAPYPLNLVLGLFPCINTTTGTPFSPASNIPTGTYFRDGGSQRTWHIDHKGGTWAISGNSAVDGHFFYGIAADFHYPFALDRQPNPDSVSDCIPWLPAFDVTASSATRRGVFDTDIITRNQPAAVRYNTAWPSNVAVLKAGETLTYPGGENKADDPNAPGLPGVIGFASGKIVFDALNAGAAPLPPEIHQAQQAARLIDPLVERVVAFDNRQFPESLKAIGRTVEVNGDEWRFLQLPPSLQRRIFYRPLEKLDASASAGVLGIRGYVNDRTLGDADLTASPPPVYILEPNVLTTAERDVLRNLAASSPAWGNAVDQLYLQSRDPLSLGGGSWNPGLEPTGNPGQALHGTVLGPGLALVSNPELLNPAVGTTPLYVTVAENDHPSLGEAPVSMHVIQVNPLKRYRGAIKTVLPANVFDEKITLRHTADFGGNPARVAYSWWYHEEDGTVRTGDTPGNVSPGSPPWSPVGSPDGTVGLNSLDLNGNPALLLADNLFFVRYRHAQAAAAPTNWTDWAGAANSSIRDLDGNGRPDFRAQLAMGWVKRVLDGLNPYEARIREFGRTDSPATGASIIASLGAPFSGPVALNGAKDVVENVGLIELYETVLARARDMSILASQPVSTPGIQSALLLASSRLAYFYSLLGNEAWDDALDPTIGFGKSNVDHGNLNASRFSFENQLPSLLEEELALLRGRDESLGRPVHNRLLWNFTKGEGEVAYALNYQVKDVNQDGFINEADALRLHPQGHGDAWGHYLSSLRKHYDLINTPGFVWQRRSEFYNLLDVVLGVDYFDERQFARTAAGRAQAGAEIVNLTRRARHSEAPGAGILGFSDTDTNRAWGVTDWARRAGQAAVFDWILGNALLPAVDAGREGIERIDRTTVTDLAAISSHLGATQLALDQSDAGLNPLGLDPNLVPFDIDPTFIDVGSTAQIGRQAVQGLSHFEQVHERAVEALRNASAAFVHANDQKARLRQVAQSADDLRQRAAAQDLEFRNRLIAIFGTPYSGQIGAGKAYPAGYEGPDYNLFMYVDINDVNADTIPVANTDTYFDEYVSFHALTDDIPERFRTDLSDHFLDDISLEGNTAVGLLGDDLVHLRLPATAADYTFLAPASWGERAAPGRLQALVGEMVQVQSELGIAVGDYDFLIKQLRDRAALLQMRAEASDTILGIKEERYDTAIALNVVINALKATSAYLGFSADIVSEIAGGIAEGLPKVVGVANDVTFPARLAIKTAAASSYSITRASAIATGLAADIVDSSKEIIDLRNEIDIDKLEMSVELRGMLYDIEELLVNEGVTRMRLLTLREQLRGLLDQYRATLQEGVRLVEERRQANVALASETQENRYHDVLFRTSRHEAIQRYRSLFDLAQRYAYTAAKAYDYESNLDPRDRASARPFLNAIVRERTLGTVSEANTVQVAGLSATLARLHETFRSVEGRLGFNNFQYDQTSFSIRNEQSRLRPSPVGPSNQDWIDKLEASRVEDLWDVPEFRRFCRPFAARGTPQPGIVLRFRTEVRAGKNFFGNPLGGGDSAYDPTLFATKIRAAGVRIEGYPIENLARTPGVYLVPAGLDYMTVPNSPTLAVRAWNVVDQAIPSPLQIGPSELGNPGWLPETDSLGGTPGEVRRFSSFRASVSPDPLADNAFNSTRLIGRSVWNDQWLLIIPGQSLHADPAEGLDRFIENVTDIHLNFETYGYSGN